MRHRSRLHDKTASHTVASLGKSGRYPQSAASTRKVSVSGLDRNLAASRRFEIDAYAMHALATSGFGDAAVYGIGQPLRPFGVRPRRRAPAHRMPRIVEAILQAVCDLVRPVVAWWWRRQRFSATYLALCKLDGRTLRDLGFDRSELLSIAAEVAGDVNSTRARLAQRFPRPFR